jgi:tetratricopeptide (TPR) repeat protein
MGNYKLAIENFNKAIALKKDYTQAYCNMGYAYLKIDQYERSIESYNKAIIYKPDYADAYSNRAFVYLNTGNK